MTKNGRTGQLFGTAKRCAKNIQHLFKENVQKQRFMMIMMNIVNDKQVLTMALMKCFRMRVQKQIRGTEKETGLVC